MRLPHPALRRVAVLQTASALCTATPGPSLPHATAPHTPQVSQQDFLDALPGALALFFALGEDQTVCNICHRNGVPLRESCASVAPRAQENVKLCSELGVRPCRHALLPNAPSTLLFVAHELTPSPISHRTMHFTNGKPHCNPNPTPC